MTQDRIEKLREILLQLPDEIQHEYELQMVKLAGQVRQKNLLDELKSLLDDSDDKVSYGAFYCHCTVLRTNRDYTLLEQFMTSHGLRFKSHASYTHLALLMKVGLIARYGDQRDFIEQAYEHAAEYPSNAGYVHMFAGAVALVLEEDEKAGSHVGAEWIDKAVEAAGRAVRLDRTYAKFHATLARLYSLNGQYAEARREFDLAVDLEDSSRGDYSLRITNYETQRMRNFLRESGRAVTSEIEVMRSQAESLISDLSNSLAKTVEENKSMVAAAGKRIDDASSKNLEFLGFFAAILSFTIGSIQIATHLDGSAAVRLLILLMGGLLVVFSGFIALVRSPTSGHYMRVTVVFLLGLAVSTVSLVFLG